MVTMSIERKLIGRDEEKRILEAFSRSERSEFLAIYGRRRVGKTFLVRIFFETTKVVFFNSIGAKNAPLSEQLNHFVQRIGEVFYKGAILKAVKNWDDAFNLLTEAIKTLPKNKTVVLFFDEFPWMATKNSRLLQNLDYYWNQHWAFEGRIKLIICGSSASWIVNKIINNKGGLYNRVTRQIHLEPFNLRDTKRFLNHRNIMLPPRQILQIYMVLGGIPYYLDRVEKGYSATQVIENLAFRKKSVLIKEFDTLYSSLFDDHDTYLNIVRTIANQRYGVAQEELFQKIPEVTKGKGGLSRLKALEDTGFIMSFKPYFQKKGIFYKVIDEYTLFYFKWIEPIKQTLLERGLRKGYWEKIMKSSSWYSWSGYAFEAVCYKHLSQISMALELSPTAIPNTWRYSSLKGTNEQGAQIDLLFDRDDDVITLCEIKYTDQPFLIDKQYADKLKLKVKSFVEKTNTKKQIFWAMVSANGLKETLYSREMITDTVTVEDLFKEE